MACRSKIDCDRFTRASNTLNGPDERGHARRQRKSEGREVHLLPVLDDAAANVRQQVGERGPARSVALRDAFFRVQQPEIVLERARDGVEDRQSGIGCAVAVPVGTPPRNGEVWRLDGVRDAPGRRRRRLGVHGCDGDR